MIKDRLIICLASAWDYDPTSKHHLMRLLSRDNHVLWVNYHGTRKPGVTRADVSSALRVLRRVGRGIERISDTMWQMTPLVVPGATGPTARRINEWLLLKQIQRALRIVERTKAGPRQVWSFAPDVPFLVGQLSEEKFVYYCVDDYPRFQCHDEDRIRAAETDLLRRADVVIATSQPLAEEKRRIRPDVHLVRHGVDFERFACAWRGSLTCPEDLAALPRPRIGFFGLIHHWIDLALIKEVAQRRPAYSFVLIGDARSDTGVLDGATNIHLLGRRPYQALPAYCAHFDAALLPFACNEMTRSINPIKMHEYLAAGLPVVSTPLPEAARYSPAIRVAETAREFAAACDAAIAMPAKSRGSAIAKLVEGETWESRIERLGEILLAGAGKCMRTVSRDLEGVLSVEHCEQRSPTVNARNSLAGCQPEVAATAGLE